MNSPRKETAAFRAIVAALVSAGAVGATLLIAWLAGGFARVGMDTNVTIALVLAILFSSLLCIALMTLIFYSDRSGRDQEARGGGPKDTDHP